MRVVSHKIRMMTFGKCIKIFGERWGSEYSQTLINKGVLQFRHAFKARRLNQKIQYIADVLYFFIVSALRRDLRVGAVLRE